MTNTLNRILPWEKMTIISHKYKLIFLKTRKTAGSSIEASLARYCGPEDIVSTSVDAEKHGISKKTNDVIKFSNLGASGWQYYLQSVFSHSLQRIMKFKLPEKRKLVPRYIQHMPALELQCLIGTKLWNDYYKVCFERNPYDRLVSFYYWRMKRFKMDCSFNDFARAVLTGSSSQQKQLGAQYFSNRPFYLDKAEVVVDFIGKYENLNEDLTHICSKCGIDFDGWLPKAKSTSRRNMQYQSMYTPELITFADEAFSLEKKLFGYEF